MVGVKPLKKHTQPASTNRPHCEIFEESQLYGHLVIDNQMQTGWWALSAVPPQHPQNRSNFHGRVSLR